MVRTGLDRMQRTIEPDGVHSAKPLRQALANIRSRLSTVHRLPLLQQEDQIRTEELLVQMHAVKTIAAKPPRWGARSYAGGSVPGGQSPPFSPMGMERV